MAMVYGKGLASTLASLGGRLGAAALMAGVLAGCTLMAPAAPAPPTKAVRVTESPTAGEAGDVYEGIRFALPQAVARRASGKSVAAEESGADGPWWLPVPQHREIELVGYPVEGSAQAARVIVYPVQEFAAANAEAAGRIEALRQLLQKQAVEPGAKLPFLPLVNAGGPLQAQVKFIAFDGGQGVRYLTQHGQGPEPINNQELFYTFQGLTDDGAHYVAAILPVTHAGLPASTGSVPEAERQAQLDNFGQYVEETTAMLEAQADESFTPSLAQLDALVESIRVEQ
jgi:hypothetical protein